MENTYILTSDGELYHYGIKGMKWGVRRYQNADGSLTAAGKKRQATLSQASDKAKEFSEMARKDSAKYYKKAETAKNAKLSDSDYQKAMRDLFGVDSKDKRYVESEARSMGYKDSRQMAKEHLGLGKEGYETYKAFGDRAKKAADFYQNLSDSYKNAPVASLNKKQIKKASKFVSNGYLENMTYREYSLKSNAEKYGL